MRVQNCWYYVSLRRAAVVNLQVDLPALDVQRLDNDSRKAFSSPKAVIVHEKSRQSSSIRREKETKERESSISRSKSISMCLYGEIAVRCRSTAKKTRFLSVLCLCRDSRNGIIIVIGRWSLKTCARDWDAWHSGAHRFLSNFSFLRTSRYGRNNWDGMVKRRFPKVWCKWILFTCGVISLFLCLSLALLVGSLPNWPRTLTAIPSTRVRG